MMLLYSGKGGVGKTTIAAASAVRCARYGHRTLVASLDRAHNLAGVLEMGACPTPTAVPGVPGLDAVEVDPQAELRRSWQAVGRPLGQLMRWLGAPAATADEVAVLPGLEELLVLGRLSELADSGRWDVVVVDLAPTASSLRYLSFPDLMAGAFGKLARLERLVFGVARPALRTLSDLPVPDDTFYEALDVLAASLTRLRARLVDPTQAVARLVAIPERIVLDETRDALTALSLFGVCVDAVVFNRVIPPEAAEGWLSRWYAVQHRELARAAEELPGVTTMELPLQPDEPTGIAALDPIGAALYGDTDPAAPRRTTPPIQLREEGGQPVLSLELNVNAAGGLELLHAGESLVVTVGGWRRALALPPLLRARAVARAVARGGRLDVYFEPEGT